MDNKTVAHLDTFSLKDIVRYVRKQGYSVTGKTKGIKVKLTGSIQDAELSEAITDAYAKHGPRLADLICNL